MSFIILTESTCDLSCEQLDERGVYCLPLGATLGQMAYKHYADEREMSSKAFYARLRAGEKAGTSAVNVSDWLAAIEENLPKSREMLILAFSSGLSSTYQNACLAAAEIMEKQDCRIEVVDTLSASGGEGLLVMEAARLRKLGMGMTAVAAAIRSLVPDTIQWFTVDDLHHLHRGGRISTATAVMGSALGIKPVIHIDDEGHLINVLKVRGRKKSLLALRDVLAQRISRRQGPILITHGDCREDAEFLADEILKLCPGAEIFINMIGPIIGGHSGPGTVALFFLGKER